ncbi:hypothetical protein [Nitratireductor pacificus]|nr:hypothetical protein [Nitratireductor pacificus]
MAVWVYRGDDFDAGQELSALRAAYTGDPDKSAGIVNGFFELMRIRDSGFLPCYAWHLAPGGVFLFRDVKFRMVATVPGDGRAQTQDVSLALSETFESRMWTMQDRDDFLDKARDRVRRGQAERWEDGI